MKITIIAAATNEWGIGLGDKMPWHLPADLRHFKRRTMDRVLIMGRRTFDGLSATLLGRQVHVISRDTTRLAFPSVEEALSELSSFGNDHGEILIAGGGEIYRAALPYCTHAEITRVPTQHPCDTYMPNLSQLPGWTLTSVSTLEDGTNLEHWTLKNGN